MHRPLSPRRLAARRGFTLLELLIVLTVLAILAAILVPMFPNFLRRANKASDATNMAEIDKAIQTYQALYHTFPNDFDLLQDGAGAFPTYLPGTGDPNATPSTYKPYDGLVVDHTLTDKEGKALAKVGITRLQPLAATVDAGNATQAPYPTVSAATDGKVVDDSATLHVAVLNTAAMLGAAPTLEIPPDLKSALESDSTGVYAVFGVGGRNTCIGRTMASAPVQMPQETGINPADNYCRYCAIFKIAGHEIDLTKRARLVAVVAMEEDEIETIDNETIGYMKVSAGEAPQ